MADLDADEYRAGATGLWTRGLLIRRNIADGECAFFTSWCPAGTTIEDGFETAKTELGLDHNETRSWHGWHRHVSLVMLAFAMLAAIRCRRLAQRRIRPARVIAWSLWRRAHQAAARRSHLKRKMQL